MTDLTGVLIGFVAGWLCGLTVATHRRSGRHQILLDPGRVQRGGPYQPKPQIIPEGQRARIPNPPPSNP
jgi:hypothetical protein